MPIGEPSAPWREAMHSGKRLLSGAPSVRYRPGAISDPTVYVPCPKLPAGVLAESSATDCVGAEAEYDGAEEVVPVFEPLVAAAIALTQRKQISSPTTPSTIPATARPRPDPSRRPAVFAPTIDSTS